MMPLPRHLRPLARVDQRSATAVHCHLRLHGEAWLQLWFYGTLINNTVQPLADNPTDSVRLVAATPAGASALFFDGSQHGVIPPKRAASKSRINTSPAFSAGRVSLLKPSYAFALE